MRATMLALWTTLAILVLCGATAPDNDLFIQEYFYDTPEEVLPDTATSSKVIVLPVVLNPSHAEDYQSFMLNSTRTEDVIVFLSTSPDAMQIFKQAADRLMHDGLAPDTRFFAVPLFPSTAEDDDFDGAVFQKLHKLPSPIPDKDFHIVAQYPAKSPSRNLAIHSDNAKMARSSTTENEWVSRLLVTVEAMKAPASPSKVDVDGMPAILTLGIAFYLLFVAIPRLYGNWQAWLEWIQSKRVWFLICLFVMYLSLSGAFYSIIHGAPLFYFSGSGFALMHPQSQRQFALEGLFGGMLPFATSAALLTLTHAMPRLLNPENRLHCIFMCGMTLTVTLFLEHALFTSKNRWYQVFF
ncbi:hypothetical protein AeMF1_017089 [Aphanomyces euteiches]|nr:hypothetical protein AeMF1_017089 [Aphanomyces euteiches]KAH9194051.1 hypothetical protein AeNC1_003974 [Aphanomyces euteiches]